MKNIILRVPSFVFILLIFMPVIIWYLGINVGNSVNLILTSRILPSLVGAIWSLSLISYMSSESKSDKYLVLASILIICQTIIHILIPFISESNPFYGYLFFIELLAMLLLFINAIFITAIVKKVFYARSIWFLFIEVWIIPIGTFTLTPDVQLWEKGDKT